MVESQNQKQKLAQRITMSTMVQDTVDQSAFFLRVFNLIG